MSILDFLVVVLILGWLGGFTMHIGGGLVHLLLVIALIMLIFRLMNRGGNKL